jgi:hypothetical protein
MKENIVRMGMVSILAAAVALAPTHGFAQEKKTDRNGGLPFLGKIDAVDKVAKTVKVGERTFHVTAETRILKAGKPATLDDAVMGDEVVASYKEAGGKLTALSLRIGPRPPIKKKNERKKE